MASTQYGARQKMTTYKIKQRAPYPHLFDECEELPTDWPEKYRPLLLEMIKICLQKKLEGLSANQLGVPIKAFVTKALGDGPRVFINPVMDILDYDQNLIEETCISFPRTNVERYRHKAVVVAARNLYQ